MQLVVINQRTLLSTWTEKFITNAKLLILCHILTKWASAGLKLAARPGPASSGPDPARFFQEISRPGLARPSPRAARPVHISIAQCTPVQKPPGASIPLQSQWHKLIPSSLISIPLPLSLPSLSYPFRSLRSLALFILPSLFLSPNPASGFEGAQWGPGQTKRIWMHFQVSKRTSWQHLSASPNISYDAKGVIPP